MKPTAVLLTACGTEETAGLPELLEKCRPVVVAAAAGIPRLRQSCPAGTEIISGRGPGRPGMVPRRAGPGRRAGRVAGRLPAHLVRARAVLFSGRIPVKISQNAGERLIADLTHPPGDIRGYFTSMTQLHDGPSPDLWLPAAPTHGQNANLYDGQWALEIEDNLRVLQSIASSTPRPMIGRSRSASSTPPAPRPTAQAGQERSPSPHLRPKNGPSGMISRRGTVRCRLTL